MSASFSWARGPLRWNDEANRSPGRSDAGQSAVIRAAAALGGKGWKVMGADVLGPDIVALDPVTNREVRIEVKSVRDVGNKQPVFVGNPEAPVDAHVFVSSDGDDFWIVPTKTVQDAGNAGVLQAGDVSAFHSNWDVLKRLK